MQSFMASPGTIQLPRFRLEYGLSLIDALKALGMSIAFDPNHADFAAMTDRPAYISEVQHKTFMEVNEAGTEAAAATSVTVTTRAALPQPPFQMTVDRPFFYAIQDETTGTILFMGAIGEPEG
jgi:serpin B